MGRTTQNAGLLEPYYSIIKIRIKLKISLELPTIKQNKKAANTLPVYLNYLSSHTKIILL